MSRASTLPKDGNWVERVWDWYFYTGYSGDSLGALRAIFGAGLLLYHITQFPHVLALSPTGAKTHFIEPIWYFELLGISTHIPWLSIPVFILMMAATVCFMIGKWTKPSILVLFICICYLKGVRDSFAGDVHHRYIVPVTLLFLFFFSKCHQHFAVDAKGKTYPAIEEWEASWPIRTAQTYIVLHYFWAIVAKLRIPGWDWFDRAGMIQSKLIGRSLRGGFGPDGEVLNRAYAFDLADHVWVIFIMEASVALFELFSLLVLIIRRRWAAILLFLGAASFHLANFILLNVQFFMYPFVFFTFFNMAWFAIRYRDKYRNKYAVT